MIKFLVPIVEEVTSDFYLTEDTMYVPLAVFGSSCPTLYGNEGLRKVLSGSSYARMLTADSKITAQRVKEQIVDFMQNKLIFNIKKERYWRKLRYDEALDVFTHLSPSTYDMLLRRIGKDGKFHIDRGLWLHDETNEIIACIAVRKELVKFVKLCIALNQPVPKDVFEVLLLTDFKNPNGRFKNLRRKLINRVSSLGFNILYFDTLPVYPEIRSSFETIEEYDQWREDLSKRVITKLRESTTYDFSRV